MQTLLKTRNIQLSVIFSFHDIPSDIATLVQHDIYCSAEDIIRFFGKPIDAVNVIVAKNYDHYNELVETKRPAWGVTTNKEGKIYLYNPELWTKKTTGHTIKQLKSSITHQMVHIFFQKYRIKSPPWFEEGLATYVSIYRNRKEKIDKDKEFNKIFKKHGFCNLCEDKSSLKIHQVPALSYLTSYKFISYLINKFSDKSLLNFINKLIEDMEFNLCFNNIYGIEVSESWNKFHGLLKKQ